MKLTDSQIKQFIAQFSHFAPGGCSCPVCGNKHRNINDTLYQSLEFTGTELKIGGGTSLIPFVLLTCKSCSYTLFFNALKCGIISSDDFIDKKEG